MNSKIKLVLIAIILSTLVLGCTTPAEKTVKSGDTVSVDYVGRYTNGTVFDTSNATIARENGILNPARVYGPLVFVTGTQGMIQGFQDAIIGMKVGETKANVTLTPDKAYGDYNASKVITVPLETLQGNNTNFTQFVGEEIRFNDDYIYVASVGENNSTARVVYLSRVSNYAPYTINVNKDNNTASLDYNHPMAGKTLVFDITLREINPSPSPTA